MIITIWRECPVCYTEHYSRIKCNEKQYIDYNVNYRGLIKPSKPIQDIFPHISKEQKEHIKTGICRNCQKAIF